jgi:pimeloyl-ACP methyl ester carboxylesterase
MMRIATALACASLASCSWFAPNTPLATTRYDRTPGTRSDTLVVLLPGRGDSADRFASEHLIDDARALGLSADIVAVDAGLSYYMYQTIAERVWTDVLAPARAQGYEHVWLLGISMGGLGALATARQHEDAIDGILLIAPFAGDDRVIDTIEKDGGLASWKGEDLDGPYTQLWTWLQGYAHGRTTPRLYLGFGTGDRLHRTHKIIAASLPANQVDEIAGDHDWPTWRALWRDLLPRVLAPSAAAAQ